MAANQGINIEAKVTGLERTEKLARALDMVAKHAERTKKSNLQNYFNQNEKALARVNREMQRNAVLQQQSGKATRRMELGFQQAGYQFQDLVVQLQGGVNPFVAISQQGSQLASFFAGPWGASIGLAIAALGSLGVALTSGKEKVKELGEEFGDLTQLEDKFKDFGKDFGVNLIGQIEAVRETFGNFVADYYEFQLRQTKEAVQKKTSNKVGAFNKGMAFELGLGNYTPQDVLDMAGTPELAELQNKVVTINELLASLTSDQIKSAEELGNRFYEVYDILKGMEGINQDGLDLYMQMGKELDLVDRRVDNIAESKQEEADALEEQVKLTEKLKGLEQDRSIDKAKAYAALLKEQGFTTEAMQLEKEIAAEILTNKAMQLAEGKALTTEQQKSLDAAIRSAQEAVQLKYELGLAKDEASELAKQLAKAESAMNAMKNFGNGLETALAKAKAEAVALATGADVATAKAIAGFRSQQSQKIQAMIDSGQVSQGFIDAEKQRSTDLINELETVLAENAAETKRQRDAAKSGRSAQSDQDKYDEYLRRQQVELDLRQKLVFMTDDQIKRAQYESELREKAAQLGVEVNEKAVQGLMKQYDVIVQLEKKRDLVNDIGDAFEDTLMSVADGSLKIKDAFQKLMFDIAKMIYQQAIVDPAVDALKSFLFQANGGVHSRGNVVPFANGGVVNGPTLFPMSSGTGLMGEAGPEAIMPLKRGKDGKLGVAGGSTTVVQNFNFSANGDESVKRIIAQEAPKIADMTQASIMDSRRRGGSMRKAFG